MTDAAAIRSACLGVALARHQDDERALALARRMALFIETGFVLSGEATAPTATAADQPAGAPPSPIDAREPPPADAPPAPVAPDAPDAPVAPDAPEPAAPAKPDPEAIVTPQGRRIGPNSQPGRILALLRQAGPAGLDNGAIAEAMQMTRLRVSVAVCDLRKAGLVERLTGSDELRHRAVEVAAEPPSDAPSGVALTDDERQILRVAQTLAGTGARVTASAIVAATGHTHQRVAAWLANLDAKGYVVKEGQTNWQRNWRPVAPGDAAAGPEPSGPEPAAPPVPSEPAGPAGGVVLPMRRQLPVPPERGRCAYPIGDPQLPGFSYCGAPTGDETAVYCRKHHALCHQQRSQPRPSAER